MSRGTLFGEAHPRRTRNSRTPRLALLDLGPGKIHGAAVHGESTVLKRSTTRPGLSASPSEWRTPAGSPTGNPRLGSNVNSSPKERAGGEDHRSGAEATAFEGRHASDLS
jgi:hypothetical protein